MLDTPTRTRVDAVLSALDRLARRRRPLPHQVPPPGDWYGWLLLAGRGAGKTEACARYVTEHVKGPACLPGNVPHRIAIIAPTLGDASEACVDGPSGLKAYDPSARVTSGRGGTHVHWTNGSVAKLFGASNPEDVERLRAGGNRCVAWLEELAAWRYLQDCWDHMRFGLRLGRRPHWVGSSTPKPRPLIKGLKRGEVKSVVCTGATTDDNPHLEEHVREALYDAYAGRQIGQQELLGLLIDEDENALWKHSWIDLGRLTTNDAPPGKRISVGVDPSGGAGEQGIVSVGYFEDDARDSKGRLKKVKHGLVFADYTCHKSPDGWGRQAVQCAVDTDADDIIVETNFGGDMALATVQGACDAMGVNIPVRKITASRGKRARMEPVAAVAERTQWHHVGVFEELEDQMCTWTDELGFSPDRVDAMVWPPWRHKVVKLTPTGGTSFSGSRLAQEQLTHPGGRPIGT